MGILVKHVSSNNFHCPWGALFTNPQPLTYFEQNDKYCDSFWNLLLTRVRLCLNYSGWHQLKVHTGDQKVLHWKNRLDFVSSDFNSSEAFF